MITKGCTTSSRKDWLFLAAGLMSSVLIGRALVTSNYLILLAIVGVVLMCCLMSYLRTLILLVLFSVFFLDWFAQYLKILPDQFAWLPEILSIILLCRIIYDLVTKRIFPKHNFIVLFVYCWLSLSIIGIFINRVDPFVCIAGFRNYFKFIPLFLALSWYPLDDRYVMKLIHLVIWIALLQIVFVIPEKIIYWGKSGDFIVGSLGANASGTLGVLQVTIFAFLVPLYKAGYYSMKTFLVYSTCILLPCFITETKLVFIIIPMVLCLYFISFKNIHLTRSLLAMCIIPLLLFAGFNIYNFIYGADGAKTIDKLLTWEKMVDNTGAGEISFGKGGQLKRLSSIHFMTHNINKNIYTALFGVGIGNASDSLFEPCMGTYYKKHKTYRIDKVLTARIGWEYGWLGLILFFTFFTKLYTLRVKSTLSPFYSGIREGTKGLVLITVVSFIYDSFLTIEPLACTFWLYLGILNNKVV